MPRTWNLKLVLAVTLLLAPFRAALVYAQPTLDTTSITAVLSVEDAQSPYGRFRVVFEIGAPLPPPTDNHTHPEFFLGSEHLRIPPGSDTSSRIFAYCDRIPTQPNAEGLKPRMGERRHGLVVNRILTGKGRDTRAEQHA